MAEFLKSKICHNMTVFRLLFVENTFGKFGEVLVWILFQLPLRK